MLQTEQSRVQVHVTFYFILIFQNLIKKKVWFSNRRAKYHREEEMSNETHANSFCEFHSPSLQSDYETKPIILQFHFDMDD
jgi:hypothetical protein